MQKVLSLLLILGMSFILQSCNNYVKSIEQFLGLTLPKHQAAGTADSAGTGGNSDTMNVDTDNNSTSDDAYKYLSNFEEERAAIVTELDAAIRIKNSKNTEKLYIELVKKHDEFKHSPSTRSVIGFEERERIVRDIESLERSYASKIESWINFEKKPTERQIVDAVKAATIFNDEKSVMFKMERIFLMVCRMDGQYVLSWYVMGLANDKNSIGNYAGYRRFHIYWYDKRMQYFFWR